MPTKHTHPSSNLKSTTKAYIVSTHKLLTMVVDLARPRGPSTMIVLCACAVACLLVQEASALTFGVLGDWGMGGYAVGWYPEIRSDLQYREQCEYLKCNFTLSVGDNIYCGDVGECMQRSFIEGFKGIGGPFFPSVGNHDNAGAQIGYKHPQWKFLNRYFSVKMPIDETGYTIQIFSVDTTDGSLGGGGQYSWLESELSKSDARWKVIFGHYPTTSSGRHKRVGTVGRIHDLMHKYNAQAYFCGHDHIVEMSNLHGRVLGLSGGISRGGMMARGIGGDARRFTLTSPGEYNVWAPDWPTHGFITVNLSPNVMNIQIFEANGGMYYDMSVTWNWMQEHVSKQPASMQHQWPSPEVVLQAYKDEVDLPLGPGGGIVFREDGTAGPSSIQPKSLAPGETPAPTTTAPAATPSPQETPVPPATIPPESATTIPQEKAPVVPGFVKYAVSSECVACGNEPTIGLPFTVFVQGVSVSSVCRVFLTSSALGCDVREKPNILPGTEVMTPSSNVVTFTVTGVSATAFVCFSMDKGQTYTRLNRVDTIFDVPDFVVNPPLGFVPNTTTAAPLVGEAATAAPRTTAPAPAPSSKDGHSSITLAFVGVLCVVGGIVGTKYASRAFS